MPRPPSAYRPVLDAADRIEPRMARAVARGLDVARSRVSINDLALALSAKDEKGALRLLDNAGLADALAPAGTIARDAVIRGGKIAAAALRGRS